MKGDRIFENSALRKVFQSVYFSRERNGSAHQWERQVMGRIRKIGPLMPKSLFWPSLENMVWRLVPVNMVLILILAFLGMGFLNMGLDWGYDYLGNIVADFESPSLSEFFGPEG